MSFKLELRPLATIEILEAHDWYESQQSGLGDDFLKELGLFYDRLVQNPFTHSFYTGSVRQGLLSRFPYLVVYEVFDNVILIYSVFMTGRQPSEKRVQ